MAFQSNLGGSVVIGDENAHKYVNEISDPSTPFSGGYAVRDYGQNPFTRPYSSPIIPRSDWDELIREREERKLTMTDLHKSAGLPVLDQNGLPYCWCYGTVGAMMMSYAQQGGYVPHLSATSAAAKGKGYRKEGGWAEEAIKYIERYGVSTFEHWPEHQLSNRYDTAEQRENASKHKVEPRSGWEELPQNNFDAVVSSILSGWPVTLGLMWWGHLVFGIRVVIIERGSYGVEIMNSWASRWENNGKAVLRENKATPHEAIAIKNVTFAHK